VSGRIKENAESFKVEELPLYPTSAEGDHVYLKLLRKNQNTKDLQLQLLRVFALKSTDIGVAGLKDKTATVSQWFSLNLRDRDLDEVKILVEKEMDVEVLEISRHNNKLKMGHLLGNRFEIKVFETLPGAEKIAKEIYENLKVSGIPNFFGVQRFGTKGDNAEEGKNILLKKTRVQDRWLRRLKISAYGSELFNRYLCKRIEAGYFNELLVGDIAKKTDTGGLFDVEDLEAENLRYQKGDISYTGPIYGAKMRLATGWPGQVEKEVLESEALPEGAFKKQKVPGSRRLCRLLPQDFEVKACEDALLFSFFLPKGSYATVLLREFMKNDDL
jgi:tRNA pseudouridine13 synthase